MKRRESAYRLGCAVLALMIAASLMACVFAYKSNVQTAHAPKQGSEQKMNQPTAGGDDSGISGSSNVNDDEEGDDGQRDPEDD